MAAQNPFRYFTDGLRSKAGNDQGQSTDEEKEITITTASSSRSFSTPTQLTQSTLLTPGVFDPYESTSHIGSLIISPASKNDTEFDIWFVHGLTGDRERTWTHSNGTFWPKLLVQDFPQARVISYGYDANIIRFEKKLQNASSEGLHSYGESLAFAIRNSRQGKGSQTRPLYFIAHSLGGLVVEQALLICIGPDESLHEIATATAGILFMGTPHQGSHLAKWGIALGKLIPDNIRTVNQKAIEVLKKDSSVCRNLENAFQEQAKNGKLKNVKLFSFYETIAMNGLGRMIVPEASAVLRGDFKCPIHGTHTSMTRFEGPNDDGYCKVKGQLTAWLLQTRQATDKKPAKQKRDKKKENRKKKKSFNSISMNGATFNGIISGGTISANQTVASGNIYYYSDDRLEIENGISDGNNSENEILDEDVHE